MFTAFKIQMLKQYIHEKNVMSFLGDLGVVWILESLQENTKNEIESTLKFSDAVFFKKLEQFLYFLKLNSEETEFLQGMLNEYLTQEPIRHYLVNQLTQELIQKKPL